MKAKNVSCFWLTAVHIGPETHSRVKGICPHALEAPKLTEDEKYWILATLYEACAGLEEHDEALRWRSESRKVATADWMRESTDNQIAKLRELLDDISSSG